MCCPTTQQTVSFFKSVEPLFWLFQILIVSNLVFPKIFFATQLNWLNKLLKYQGFEAHITFSEKAYKIWYRDLCVLFFLNLIVIGLIHLI